mmetsp:Transcript_42315/g.69763  ORF Transcript_42315/g.69763 Transcript_42315/m.69763 type:complete len:282 (+) Transcript_42315:87-932(+)|eukprot:CAMPEP_0202698246 /NCGR_PEP_ID=MMETSP1385-20130828/11520_1 /ASSEMBLY_ACC=CAM_ASM_000861 /TAXON_ID=933848 /ORGANISM="Elphidium margaritaceum" /LENGTH=281 /DNA_ID=CAMNT_0049354905 /DNA_START=65 /DNA_END=910 /DNA_ORIENTATION=-
MADEKQQEIKPLPPYLFRPTAIMRLFHEAAREGFKDISRCLSECEKSLTQESVNTLVGTFNELLICIDIHKNHEDNALYPAVVKSIKERLENKNYVPSKEQLENGLKEVPSFGEEHKVDHEKLHRIESGLSSLLEAVQKKDNAAESKKNFDSLSVEFNAWLKYHEDHLKHEESVLAPLMKNVGANKQDKVKIARTLLALNRDLVLKHQFGYVLKQLLKVETWFCPMTKHEYKDNEILIAYVNCFRAMSETQELFQPFWDKAVEILNDEQVKELKSYGVDKK